MKDKELFEIELRENGLKITKARTRILEILKESCHPLAAEEIFLGVKSEAEKMNLSTVYRTLETLEETGLITKLGLVDDKKLYEYHGMGHRHYLVCLGCRQIITIENCPLHEYEKQLEKDTEFAITGHKLYLYGYCKECARTMR